MIHRWIQYLEGSRSAKKPHELRPDAPAWVPDALNWLDAMGDKAADLRIPKCRGRAAREELGAAAPMEESNKRPSLIHDIEIDDNIEDTNYSRNLEGSASEPGDLHSGIQNHEIKNSVKVTRNATAPQNVIAAPNAVVVHKAAIERGTSIEWRTSMKRNSDISQDTF
jgi:hypothetical protein